MRYPTGSKPVLPPLLPDGKRVASGVLVAGVQCIIRPSHKDPAPLDQTCREKSGYRADNYLLKERRMHL